MKISVIVPVYNVEQYIQRCIDSILAQTFTDFELILVDDGSTDKSGKICDSYARKDSRIRVFHHSNQGQSVARNFALDWIENNSDSEWISFIDSDDYVNPELFNSLMKVSEKRESQIIVFDYFEGTESNFIWPERIEHFTLFNGRDFLRSCLINNKNKCWVLWDKIFKRECFSGIRFPEGRVYEDNAIVYKILYSTEKVILFENVLYYYFANHGSTTKQTFSERTLDWLKVLEEMIDFFDSKDDYEVRNVLLNRYFYDTTVLFRQLVENYPTSTRIKKTRRSLRYYCRKFRTKYSINIKTRPDIYNIIYPNYSKAYWFLVALKNKLKNSGVNNTK